MGIVEQLSKVALLGSEWVLWLLIALSVLSIAIVLERVVFFRRNRRGGEALREGLVESLATGDAEAIAAVLADNGSVEGRVLRSAFAWRGGGVTAFESAVESEVGRERPALERGSTVLGTIGNNAPFIGLLGTVIGVIDAFHHLASASSGNDSGAMGNVMYGISEALVATGVGIFVAIPAVIAFNALQRQVELLENDTHALGKLLAAWLETNGATASAAADGVSPFGHRPTTSSQIQPAHQPSRQPTPLPTGVVAAAE